MRRHAASALGGSTWPSRRTGSQAFDDDQYSALWSTLPAVA
jgi:hypothetical protein